MTPRYLLFSGEFFYARGGWWDSMKGFDDLAEAIKLANERVDERGHEWWHVIDLTTNEIVAQSDRQAYGVD